MFGNFTVTINERFDGFGDDEFDLGEESHVSKTGNYPLGIVLGESLRAASCPRKSLVIADAILSLNDFCEIHGGIDDTVTGELVEAAQRVKDAWNELDGETDDELIDETAKE